MNPLAWIFGDLLTRPRLIVPLLPGIGVGAGLFHVAGKEPSSAAIAVGCALLGLAMATCRSTSATHRAVRGTDGYSTSKRSNAISSVSNTVSASVASSGEVR